MVKSDEIYEIKTDRLPIPQSQNNGEITFRGNRAYDRVLGVNVYIEKSDGSEFNGDAKVGIREIGGGNRVLLSSTPYRLIKHSDQVSFPERFLEFTDLKGNGNDLGVNIDTSALNATDVVVYATVLYSKNK